MNISPWPKPDERWYLGVRCKKCRMPIVFALDRSEGIKNDGPPSAQKLVLTCSVDTCGHQADYTTASVSRFQRQPVKPIEGKKNESNKSGKARR